MTANGDTIELVFEAGQYLVKINGAPLMSAAMYGSEQAMATIACLNPTRVFVGVGTGESMNEVPVLGIEWPEFKVRFGRMKEAIEIMRRLWADELLRGLPAHGSGAARQGEQHDDVGDVGQRVEEVQPLERRRVAGPVVDH